MCKTNKPELYNSATLKITFYLLNHMTKKMTKQLNGLNGGSCDFSVTPVPIGLGFWFGTTLGVALGLGVGGTGLGTRAWQLKKFQNLFFFVRIINELILFTFALQHFTSKNLVLKQFETIKNSSSLIVNLLPYNGINNITLQFSYPWVELITTLNIRVQLTHQKCIILNCGHDLQN